jgi:hypothetical protein
MPRAVMTINPAQEAAAAAKVDSELREPLIETVTVSKRSYNAAIVITLLLVSGLIAMCVLLALKISSSSTSTSAAVADSTNTTTTVVIEIAGAYTDAYGTDVTVTSEAFTTVYPGDDSAGPAVIDVTFFSNTMGFLVGKNSGAGSYYPDFWSRIDWHTATAAQWGAAEAGKVAYCTSLYNAESEFAAMRLQTQLGGAVDPDVYDISLANSTGCGGYPFTILSPT